MVGDLSCNFQVEAVLSSRGQITLPKELRVAMFLKQGYKIQFKLRNGEVTLSTHRVEAADPISHWIGTLPSEIGAGRGKIWVRKLRGYEGELLD